MAEEVPGDLAERRSAVFGRPPKATKPQAFAAWLLVYGVYYTLYVLSFMFVFYGPFARFEITWLGWVFNYLIVGALWGATFVPRRFVRSRLHMVGLKIKKSRRALRYRHEKFDTGELKFFGPSFGLLLTVFLLAYLTAIFAVGWVLAVLVEMSIWSDRTRHN